MPLHRRIPKRGFHNPFKRTFAVVNVESLNGFPAGETVTPELLLAVGLVRQVAASVKVLGEGDLQHALTVQAHAFSKSAAERSRRPVGRPKFCHEPVSEAFAKLFLIPDLRVRILFVLAALLAYRILS